MSENKESALNLNDLDVRAKDLDEAASHEITGGAGPVLRKTGPTSGPGGGVGAPGKDIGG